MLICACVYICVCISVCVCEHCAAGGGQPAALVGKVRPLLMRS